MVSLVQEYYTEFIDTKSDPRTKNWFLMSSPGPTITLIAVYLYFCKWAGPAYMKDRKPFELKRLLQFYNFSQVLISIYLVYEHLQSGWWNDYSLTCQPVDRTDNPKARRMAAAVWCYYFCKLIELLDTVFFVLRKKMNQVSFLHLYHHALMPVFAWVGTKFLPTGHGTLLIPINSFIHVLMYSYYLLASMGPQYQKYLWWKKHLTAMQMVQFFIIGVHNIQTLFNHCDYPKLIAIFLGAQSILFFYLFGSFYVHTYSKPEMRKELANNINSSKIKLN